MAESIGVSSTTLTQSSPKATEFGEMRGGAENAGCEIAGRENDGPSNMA